MTNNLTQAIEEVKRAAERGWYWPGAAMSKDTVTNTIINAVATGDLTPKADHEAVLAWPDGGAVDARLLAALRSGEQADADGCRVIVSREACENAADIIEALASALAELQALRDERDEWRRLAIAGELTAKLQGITERRAEAAEAELATLRAQVERLTGALGIVADEATSAEIPGGFLPVETPDWHRGYDAAIKKARAALTEGSVRDHNAKPGAL